MIEISSFLWRGCLYVLRTSPCRSCPCAVNTVSCVRLFCFASIQDMLSLMKYLAIDFGLRRTGIAVSDEGGRMAFPRTTIAPGKNATRAAFFDALLDVLRREAPAAVVVGLPLTAEGDDSLTTRQVRNFVQSLKRRTDLPVYWMNETLSSQEAEADLHEAGLFGRQASAVLDQQAAVRILDSFLNLPPTARIPA